MIGGGVGVRWGEGAVASYASDGRLILPHQARCANFVSPRPPPFNSHAIVAAKAAADAAQLVTRKQSWVAHAWELLMALSSLDSNMPASQLPVEMAFRTAAVAKIVHGQVGTGGTYYLVACLSPQCVERGMLLDGKPVRQLVWPTLAFHSVLAVDVMLAALAPLGTDSMLPAAVLPYM